MTKVSIKIFEKSRRRLRILTNTESKTQAEKIEELLKADWDKKGLDKIYPYIFNDLKNDR